MLNAVARAKVAANKAQMSLRGVPALYHRGSARCELTVVLRDPQNLVDLTTGGVAISHQDQDFDITAEELILNGRLATPEHGDRIEVIDTAETFEVLPRNKDECWRWENRVTRVTIRVLTKLVQHGWRN